ncbi:MAG: DUF748 domain-containing protein [Elusimicrobiota bacterium]|nr:MAG: DUF748 domain-containing protein [Elusimicrobiota bacterium]
MSALARVLTRANGRGVRLAQHARRRRVMALWIAGVILTLAGLRAALPWAVKSYANRRLARLDGYKGALRDVDVHLWRGAYAVRGLKIEKADGGEVSPFFECEEIDFSVEWGALLRGRLVGEIALLRPRMNLRPEAAERRQRGRMDRSRAGAVDILMPLEINRLTIEDGFVRWRDDGSKPPFAVDLEHMDLRAENFETVRGAADARGLPATVRATSRAFGTGTLAVSLDADPLAKTPTFELRSVLRDVELSGLNDLLDAYAKFRVNKGTLALYAEAAAKDGGFTGYVKPIIKDLEVDKSRRSFLKKLWAHVAAAAGVLLKNQAKDQIATKIPFEGEFGDADPDLWSATGGLLKNAFIRALTPSLEGGVKIKNVDIKR